MVESFNHGGSLEFGSKDKEVPIATSYCPSGGVRP
jgi:hypothetical protein